MDTDYLAAFATLFSWTISTFALATLTRLTDSSTLNRAVLFFSTFILGIVVCILDAIDPLQLFTKPSASNWLWFGISGIIGKSIGDYLGYQSFRILGARRRSMIAASGPGFTWLFGLIILSENMNWLGLAAMTLTLISLILFISVSAERSEVTSENFGTPVKGFLYGISAAALTGLAFIISKMTITEKENDISAYHGTWIRIITAFLALMVYDIFRGRKFSYIKPFFTDKQKPVLLLLTILFGAVFGLSFSLIAISKMNAAVAYTIFAMLPVSITIISVLFFKKRISFLSVVFSLLAIGGVLILLWRDKLINLI